MFVCTPFFDTTVGLQTHLAGKCGLIRELYEPKMFDSPNPRGGF